jgi:hypothetical protein
MSGLCKNTPNPSEIFLFSQQILIYRMNHYCLVSLMRMKIGRNDITAQMPGVSIFTCNIFRLLILELFEKKLLSCTYPTFEQSTHCTCCDFGHLRF